MRISRSLSLALMSAVGIALLAPASGAVVLQVDSSQSSSGGAPLSGSISVELGDPLPNMSNTTFDVTAVDITGGGVDGIAVALDQTSFGVLSPSGNFLIPIIFLTLTQNGSTTDFALLDLLGSFTQGPGACGAGAFCLQTDFQIEILSGPNAGIIDVSLTAIPEPGTLLLVGLGLCGLGIHRPRRTEISR